MMDNTKNTSENTAVVQDASQLPTKRARSDSHQSGTEDPPAKRAKSPSPEPPLAPEQKTQEPPASQQDDPKSKPAAPAPAPRSKASSPSNAAADPPKSSSPPPAAPTKTATKPTSKKSAPIEGKMLKGLRHFSMMVCKKVEEKQETTYNEVADELVRTVMEVRRREDPNGKFDEKNIRRRVYDSINVLLAMDIISKDKKQISWKGLPSTAHHDLQMLEREEEARKKQVEAKRKQLQEILLQHISFRNLVVRNKERERETRHAERVPLPMIVVSTQKDAIIHCNMAPDLTNVMFEYDRPFDINDDNSILTRLGMHRASKSTLREMVPNDLVNYCQEHGLLDSVLGEAEAKAPPVLGLVTEGNNKGQYFRSIS